LQRFEQRSKACENGGLWRDCDSGWWLREAAVSRASANSVGVLETPIAMPTYASTHLHVAKGPLPFDPMVSKQKLLDAAARIYGEYGFRGATTRRIADQAGVNEVTLFRLFGSKSALIAEAIRSHAPTSEVGTHLPDDPVDPERELAAFCADQLAHLRSARALIRKAMSDLEEHPEMGPCMGRGPMGAFNALRSYASKLTRADGSGPVTPRELSAASAMLVGALFADAMGREMMPEMYPQPEASAPVLYARLFLRALGCHAAAEQSGTTETTSPRRASLRGRHG
jgi:AcrR family transcriptional regulator